MAALDPRISLRDPWLAGGLAFLCPGAGHLYQGRFFKAVVYAVCILGLFLSGMALAGWRAVQAPPLTNRQIPVSRLEQVKFLAQLPVGLPVLYSLVQSHRYYSELNKEVSSLNGSLKAACSGEVQAAELIGDLVGSIHLVPARQQFGSMMIAGEVVGVLDGQRVTLSLEHVVLEKPIRADRERRILSAQVVEDRGDRTQVVGSFRGKIVRPLNDWMFVPLDERQQQELHRELGKFHELAMVFTWVAGLLNILAIWDAVEGPAYGYGDEEPNDQE